MTCRLNFLYSCFPFWEHALQSEVPSRLLALYNLLGPPSLNRFVRLFPIIYNCWLPEFFGHQAIFSLSSRKSYCLTFTLLSPYFHLTFTGVYFYPIFYRPFPQGVQILLQLFYVVFICAFSIYYTVVSEESNSSRYSSKYHLRTLEIVVGPKCSLVAHVRLLWLPWICRWQFRRE